METPRLHSVILRAMLVVVLASLALLTLYLFDVERVYIEREKHVQLESTARMLAGEFPRWAGSDPAAWQERIQAAGAAAGVRLTVILPDGVVVADSEATPTHMENHASRPEIAEALHGATGTARRYSATIHRDLLYVAVPIKDGDRVTAVMRAALPLRTVQESLAELHRRVLVAALVLVLLVGGLSAVLARRISRPVEKMTAVAKALADGHMRQRVIPEQTRELADLARAMNSMAEQIGQKMDAVEELLGEQRAIFLSMVEGLLVIDHNQTLVDLNQAAADMLHVERTAVRGRQMLEVVRNRELVRLVEHVVQSGTTTEGLIVVYGADPRHLQVHATPLQRSGAAPRGVVMVLSDVTRLRHLETMRRDFVANASHELKTPVTSIKGFAETMEAEDLSPEEMRRFVGIISRQADHLATLIDDLLALTRIEHEQEAGALTLVDQPVRPMLEAAVETCQPEADEKGLRLEIEADDSLQATMDGSLMERAVTNLVDNAIKYSDRGTIRVTAAVKGENVEIVVSDEGPGIPREHVGRIFERFYRVDKARSRKLGGTGLGLSIVKHIVQAHRGDISVSSTVGRGSSFIIRWPRAGKID